MEKLNRKHKNKTRYEQSYHLLNIASSPLKMLQTGAHPDDESSHLLSLLARKYGIQVIYICATRGEGGQNDASIHFGHELALIRTEEMRQAAENIPMEQYWINKNPTDQIRDFGFSSSGQETLDKWGSIEPLIDAFVYHIRYHQPDLLCPSFLDVEGQHGHHKAVTRATIQAFYKAADKDYICKVDKNLDAWQCAKLLLPAWGGGGNAYDDTTPPPKAHSFFNLAEIDVFSGQTYFQIGENSRQKHKSQSMGFWLNEGISELSYFGSTQAGLHILDTKIGDDTNIFSGLSHNFASLCLLYEPDLKKKFQWIDKTLNELKNNLSDTNSILAKSQHLLKEIKKMKPKSFYIQSRIQQLTYHLDHIIRLYSNIFVRIKWDNPHIIAQYPNNGKIRIFNGNHQKIKLKKISCNPFIMDDYENITIDPFSEHIIQFSWKPLNISQYDTQFSISSNGIYASTTYKNIPNILLTFLMEKNEISLSAASFDDPLIKPAIYMDNHISERINNNLIHLSLHNITSATQQGELSVKTQDNQKIFSQLLSLHPGKQDISITPDIPQDGRFNLYWNDDTLQHIQKIELSHLKQNIYTIQAAYIKQLHLKLDDIAKSNIAFIFNNSLAILNITKNLGNSVDVYTQDNISQFDPNTYDTIILDACIRATYSEKIDQVMPIINTWVHQGGRLISLYQRPQDDVQKQMQWIGNFTIGTPSIRWRETDATASISAQDIPLLSSPNKIGKNDWLNWIQERGLYFVSDFDPPYQSALTIQKGNSCFDGSLIIGNFSEGKHIHCSLSLERQLRALHKGAICLWMNILWS